MLRRLFSLEHALDWLLIFIPISAALRHQGGSPLAVFVTSGLAIVPLAGLMGRATEALAERAGPGVGGLLNATFGNAAELIIGLTGLRAGEIEVVQASLTGSIIGNLLFVLGLAALVGGARREKQTFNRTAAGMACSILFLAAAGLLVPTLLAPALERQGLAGAVLDARMRTISEAISVVLLAVYVMKLLFSLRTHRHLYDDGDEVAEAADEPQWSPAAAIAVLAGATALTALAADSLVGAVDAAARDVGLSRVFIGVILIAIVGNAAEHSTAVVAARKGKMSLALTISLESSQQIALFVAPALVFASTLYPNARPMTLHFTDFEAFSVAIAVGSATMISQDGETNWLEGVQLLAVYAVLAIAFYFAKVGP
jgi:Ca2+:H+ antiporter